MVVLPKSVVNLELLTETPQESIPEKTGNLDAPDHGNATHLDDYIPLPSIEPEEIEDPSEGFLCGADLSSLWPFTKVGGTDGDKQVDDDTRCLVQGGWDSDYSKPASCSSGPKISTPQVDHKKIDDSSGLQVQGLLTETPQESIPEKTGNLDAPDHGNATHLDDYIPLPSLEPEEIEDPSEGFLCGADLSSLWPFTKVGGTDGDKQVDDDTRCLVQGGWDSDYSKPASCSSGPKISTPQVDHKKIDDSSGLQVQGLYSDKMRTSAFLRLSGLGKVLGKERHCCSKVDNLGDVLKGLDERHKMWKCKSSIENTSRISVFSRLRRDVGKAPEGEKKSMDVAKKIKSQNLKRKSSCSVKISEKDDDYLPGNQQGKALESHSKVVLSDEMKSIDIVKDFISQTLKHKISSNVKHPGRRLRSNCSRKRSRTRTSNSSSSVADHSEGSSFCTINSTCHEDV
ncbi:uncharacterized protein LOC110706385 [Chenopodium quinoa]|uniref:Uncharacterized protein n=1 Tax=Chenopodium quinoa TaxID=63459 RepID=A0A803N7W5_CHEQI|nr:uncharacterized protein LOC110706385 [Chenopodium quinoa]